MELATGDIERRARRQNAGFRTLVRLGRPHVTYKAAVSIDGRVAAPGGEPRWISSPQSRALVHEWRARSGAVAVGIGTALADDPMLTARDCVPPAERQPLRVVFDRAARLPVGSALVRSVGEGPVAVVCRPGAPGIAALAAAGVEAIEASDAGQALAELGAPRRGDGAAGGRPHPRRGAAAATGWSTGWRCSWRRWCWVPGRMRWRAGPPCGWARGSSS